MSRWSYPLILTASLGLAMARSPQVVPASAQEPQAPAPASSDESTSDVVEQARAFQGQGRYEDAIQVLEPLLEQTDLGVEQLRQTYILLIEAHVGRANSFPPRAKDRDLWLGEARRLVRECLSTRPLRHTRVDPESYPEEMVTLFDEIRREIFGTLWITSLEPPDAEVRLDGELMQPDEDGTLQETDVAAGPHVVELRHPDYQDVTDPIEIAAAQVLTKDYVLPRNKGVWWYVSRVGVPVAVVAGVVVALVSGDEPTQTAPEPLPEPPGPPSQ